MKFLSCLLLLASVMLTGCVGVAVEGARMSSDSAVRDQHTAAALAGDAEAQYKVGKSYCCAPRNDTDAFYDNRKATDFLCRAARQHHAGAAYELGKIHSGDTVQGLRLVRRAATLVVGDSVDEKAVAHYWFDRAADWGQADARSAADKLGAQDTSRFTDVATAPCTIDEVYGPAR
jgi:TPR repeat protein